MIFSYLSQIEVALRSRLVNALQITQDALILNDPSAFKDKQLYWKNQATIASEISRSNDVFIKHNFNSHDGAIPLWACVEIMSFGTISKTIKNMKAFRLSACVSAAVHRRDPAPYISAHNGTACRNTPCPAQQALTGPFHFLWEGHPKNTSVYGYSRHTVSRFLVCHIPGSHQPSGTAPHRSFQHLHRIIPVSCRGIPV